MDASAVSPPTSTEREVEAGSLREGVAQPGVESCMLWGLGPPHHGGLYVPFSLHVAFSQLLGWWAS